MFEGRTDKVLLCQKEALNTNSVKHIGSTATEGSETAFNVELRTPQYVSRVQMQMQMHGMTSTLTS